ncbi:TetR/AcrR family transcriptional regulator [Achromobacter mucicolens]|jgi:AcrR family transcriptional regulator|uniref:TetR/AcrR family transcriptional regulator n=1 Tax=Achromobacter TaxID=222 RepID=UPI0006F83C27|nr:MULTISPECIES: TetR/AcrR family transcriptional regulator [Achromobacter]KRB17345.1 TetR family transcriptional regulator [Achromobacter sp. Root170]MCP2513723.1 TetR/AcrR family transcriptional regulator [Achromobacter mucicolens]MDF2861464.1 TetR/AcrR family transcriptional regulator [Achromobacter mucicolens]MDH1522708.1 TetR/AcrR family transcriptional regulator [Achromobacter mucicolens]UAN03981.1 TetR/AcrR family transcriptional regulator [Achromobacter mucicolens]
MITALPDSAPQDKRLTKGERTRRQLLTVAAAEFAERGFQHTRVSDIVARAGVTQPVFYQYFTSKQAAYDELVGLFAQRLRQAISQARLPGDLEGAALVARIRQGIGTLLAILQEDPNLTRIGFFQADAAEALKDELVALIADNVRSEQQAGLFRPEISPEWFGQSLMGIIERFTRQLPDAATQKALAEFMTDLLLDGMRRR